MSQARLNPRQALIVIRIIWAALLMGVLIFAGLVLFVLPPRANAPDPLFARTLLYVAVVMLCVLVPVGWLIRRFIWRAGRTEDGTVSPGAYNTGNIIQLAMCEGVAFMSLVGAMLNVERDPFLVVAAIAIAVMVVSFPTGRSLRSL